MTINAKSSNPGEVILLVGTRKGAFIFSSDRDRTTWQIRDLMFKSWNVMHMTLDRRDRKLHAAVVHEVYGPSTHYSDDMGATWFQAEQVPEFSSPSRSGRPLGDPDEVRDEDTLSFSVRRWLWTPLITPVCMWERLRVRFFTAAMPVTRGRCWRTSCPRCFRLRRSSWINKRVTMRIQLATCKKLLLYIQEMSFHIFVPRAKFCKKGNRSRN